MAASLTCAAPHAADAPDLFEAGVGAPARTGAAEPRQPGPARSTWHNPDAAERQWRAALADSLPLGFRPLKEVRDVALLGRWPQLEDRMSACVPARVVSAMQLRSALGDLEADAWLRLHARACSGDAAAQLAFGKACEKGLHRASADLQRAFFWYYRASLQGNAEAVANAERLIQCARISPAVMADPVLVYPGQWRITAHLSASLRPVSLFDLAEDGTATGRLLDYGEDAAVRSAAGTSSDNVAPNPSAARQPACYRGGWAYDGYGNVLTIVFDAKCDGDRRWRNDHWQIRMHGCSARALFGRDRRMVGYSLERLDATRRDQ